jgi:hypothetical protein
MAKLVNPASPKPGSVIGSIEAVGMIKVGKREDHVGPRTSKKSSSRRTTLTKKSHPKK